MPSGTDLIDFLVMYVIVRGIIAKWLARLITRLLRAVFVRSEQEVRLYMAYRDRASKRG